MEYSGRTTAYEHKRDSDWQVADLTNVRSAIRQETVFEVQWSDCPVEVENEVRELWIEQELGNDFFYYPWDSKDESDDGNGTLAEQYPIIAEYLKSKGVTECLIHWWW